MKSRGGGVILEDLVKKIDVGSVYRHYKGGMYFVVDVAIDTELEGNYIVIYHTIGDAKKLFAQSIKLFLDRAPENKLGQKNRFEKIEMKKLSELIE